MISSIAEHADLMQIVIACLLGYIGLELRGFKKSMNAVRAAMLVLVTEHTKNHPDTSFKKVDILRDLEQG
jgi:hypothetical protein